MFSVGYNYSFLSLLSPFRRSLDFCPVSWVRTLGNLRIVARAVFCADRKLPPAPACFCLDQLNVLLNCLQQPNSPCLSVQASTRSSFIYFANWDLVVQHRRWLLGKIYSTSHTHTRTHTHADNRRLSLALQVKQWDKVLFSFFFFSLAPPEKPVSGTSGKRKRSHGH